MGHWSYICRTPEMKFSEFHTILSTPPPLLLLFQQCLFKDNQAYKQAGSIVVQGNAAMDLAIVGSVFDANAVLAPADARAVDNR